MLRRNAELPDPASESRRSACAISPLAVALVQRGAAEQETADMMAMAEEPVCSCNASSSVPQLHERSVLCPDLVAKIGIGRLHGVAM